MKTHEISSDHLTIERVRELVFSDYKIVLGDAARQRIQRCRSYLDHKLQETTEPIYGINTGFGSLYDKSISNDELEQLQENLVKSHACGVGDTVPNEIVRLMLFLKVQGLSYGHSGVAVQTVERLLDFLNHKIYPLVYEYGSLGASGDLAPLANLSLALLGEGFVHYKGQKRAAAAVLKELHLAPIRLQSKEGLALLNGTQFMSAYGVYILMKARHTSEMADLIGALSLEGYDGRMDPFQDNVHLVRNHPGQLTTAQNLRRHLEGSELTAQHKQHVQDPYSFRCMPQVHGASKDAMAHVKRVVEIEINSVTDNPTIFPEEDKVVSAGNFHGQPLAINLDYLAIALAELGSISERRTYKLISGTRGLPPFLVANPGVNSGFMIPQYAIASVVSSNKQLCTPCSVDTIDSSNGQEDHVSMGANAATKCFKVMQNVERILGVELFNAAQALQFRRPLKSSPTIESLVEAFRKEVAFVEDDIVMHEQMAKAISFVRNYPLD